MAAGSKAGGRGKMLMGREKKTKKKGEKRRNNSPTGKKRKGRVGPLQGLFVADNRADCLSRHI